MKINRKTPTSRLKDAKSKTKAREDVFKRSYIPLKVNLAEDKDAKRERTLSGSMKIR
jgi:hypothetical protein